MRASIRSAASLALALAVLYALLAAPNHPGALDPAALSVFPLELPAVVLLLLLLPGRVARAVTSAALTALTAMRLADLAAFAAFARPFNPALDLGLVPAAWRLTSGTVGAPLAFAAALAIALALGFVALTAWWASGRIARAAPARRAPLVALLLPALALPALDATRRADPPGAAAATRLAFEHGRDAIAARADLARFRAEAATDPEAARPQFAALAGTDIFVIFVESYGRSALDNPRYAPTIRRTLTEAQSDLAARGLAARSAFLTAPMVGGQSWLAHGTLLSGLRLDTDARYRALLASPRKSLTHFAGEAGWTVVAVMPAITLAWPEAAYFGYDRILAAADLGYRGRAFNWVTMPDQFTLAAFEQLALARPRPPVFAEIALISSHAPWTPIPPLLPWDALGDGHVFDAAAAAGDAPEIVWRDQDRVRDQYRQALAYSLATVAAFAAREAGDRALIVVLGDHQPAAFVSEDPDGREVPIHIIGAPEVLARLDGWHWTAGLLPGAEAPVWPMEAFRDRFLGAFARM